MRTAVLLSGGMDSAAMAVWKRPEVAITIDYGQQPASGEIRAAQEISNALSIEHHIISVDCSSLGSGDMAGQAPAAIAPIPEWWPFRNQLLVTLAAMKAVSIQVDTILVGSVAGDAQHIDGSASFYNILDRTISIQEGSIHVLAPAIQMTTVELIRASGISRELLGWCHSCHKDEHACGHCRGCYKHISVREAVGLGDVAVGD